MAFLQTALIKPPVFPDAELPKQFYAQQGYRFMYLPQAVFLLLKSSTLCLFHFFFLSLLDIWHLKNKSYAKFWLENKFGILLSTKNIEICKVKPRKTLTIKANAFLQRKESTKPTCSCCSGSGWNKERAVLNMLSALLVPLTPCFSAAGVQNAGMYEWFTAGSELLLLRKTKQLLTRQLVASGIFVARMLEFKRHYLSPMRRIIAGHDKLV